MHVDKMLGRALTPVFRARLMSRLTQNAANADRAMSWEYWIGFKPG